MTDAPVPGTDHVVNAWPTFAKAPVLVVTLAGWIDAGGAGANAMAAIEQQVAARTVVTFDADTYIDYRARRPTLELRDGVNSRIVWPTIEMKAGADAMGTPVLLLTGHEPDAQWQRFSRTVLGLADRFGVATMIGLGAYPFGTPHTRASRLSLSCSSPEVAASLPYARNSVDVPAGVQAVLERGFADAGKTAIGLWAQVPHYVANMPYPAAAAALLRGLGQVTSLAFGTDALDQDAVNHESQLNQLIAANEEHASMLHQLEQAYDTEGQLALGVAPPINAADIPSADELAAELERFLREQGR
jgi:proteasome assembly chaperone (PAC2) family protein